MASSIYQGEHADLRLRVHGWDSPGFDADAWPAVAFRDDVTAVPEPRTSAPVRAVAESQAIDRITTPSGATLLDFGQNLVGRLRYIQVFAPTAAFLYDCDAFLGSWLEDLRLEQQDPAGVVPMVVPAVIPQVPGQDQPIAAWGDAVTVVPTVLDERFGDRDAVRSAYAGMRAWVDVVAAEAGDDRIWDSGPQFGDWLAEVVRISAYHISAGFVGTPIVTDALVDTGHADAAARLLLQTESPSWLYPVTMGATTVWERWDSMLPDGSINPGQMTSFNHYALGAVADWIHRLVAGLAPAGPGYAEIEVAPTQLDGLQDAAAWLETPYGRAESGWRREGAEVRFDVLVPANTTARVTLPDGERADVGSGRHRWTKAMGTTAAPPAPTLDSPLADVADRQDADPGWADLLAHRTRWVEGRCLASVLNTASTPVVDAIREALAGVAAKAPAQGRS